MDRVIYYMGEQNVIELKIWRGMPIMSAVKNNYPTIWNIFISRKDIC